MCISIGERNKPVLIMKIEIRGICMRQKSVNQYVRRVHKNERNANAQYKISLLSKFISFASLVYMYVYVRTFLNSMPVLVFCDRNSIAKKQKNFQHERQK